MSEHSIICRAVSWSELFITRVYTWRAVYTVYTVPVARSAIVQSHDPEGWEGRRGIANQKTLLHAEGMSGNIHMTM